MATARELAEDALKTATAFVEEHRGRLLEGCEGDLQRLHDAARIVQEEASAGASDVTPSAEHLAFSLLTAAFDAGRRAKARAAGVPTPGAQEGGA